MRGSTKAIAINQKLFVKFFAGAKTNDADPNSCVLALFFDARARLVLSRLRSGL